MSGKRVRPTNDLLHPSKDKYLELTVKHVRTDETADRRAITALARLGVAFLVAGGLITTACASPRSGRDGGIALVCIARPQSLERSSHWRTAEVA